MGTEAPRSRRARAAAEAALVRVAHHYGTRPEFVLIGGLVPDLLCAGSPYTHAGTTDIDVQVDLEIQAGSVNARRLERALVDAGFTPDGRHGWRWVAEEPTPRTVVKFELLADDGTAPAGATLNFDGCDHLAAANLRGTGFASRDIVVRELTATIAGVQLAVEINVTRVLPDSCSQKSLPLDRDVNRKTGTTSPSCFSTTTLEVPRRRREPCATAFPTTSRG